MRIFYIMYNKILTWITEFQDKTFLDHLIDVPWDEPLLTQRVEETLYKGKHINFCRLSNDTLAMVSSHWFAITYTSWRNV